MDIKKKYFTMRGVKHRIRETVVSPAAVQFHRVTQKIFHWEGVSGRVEAPQQLPTFW